MSSDVYYMIPWRAVHNENSVSTPCRLVFDASQGTRSGCSLNSMLAKGINSLNSLVGIILRWTTYPHVFTTDVSKMYNRVNLDPEHWKRPPQEGVDSRIHERNFSFSRIHERKKTFSRIPEPFLWIFTNPRQTLDSHN